METKKWFFEITTINGTCISAGHVIGLNAICNLESEIQSKMALIKISVNYDDSLVIYTVVL